MVNENEQEVPQSYILLQFTAPGTVIFQSTFENITPYQMLAVAHFLEFEGKLALQQQKIQEAQRQQEMPTIALPGKPQVNLGKKP